MRSVLVLGLPRSLTSFVFAQAREAIGLEAPRWTTDGEILNPERWGFATAEKRPRPLHPATDEESYQAALAFLDDVIEARGRVYKDVLQPFVMAEYASRSDLRVLHVRRPLADVAYHIARRGWVTPNEDFVESLVAAQAALDAVPGAGVVAFDDLIVDEVALSDVLGVRVRYLTDAFRRRRDEVLALRETPEHAFYAERVREAENRVRPPLQERLEVQDPDPARVLVVSEALCPTGFGRVGYEILKALSPHYQVEQVGINYRGQPHTLPWRVHSATLQDGGEERIASVVCRTAPDLALLLNDPWVLGPLAARIRERGYTGRLVGYCPVDAGPLPGSCGPGLGEFDALVAYTDFGRSTLEQLFQTEAGVPPLSVIPHGVDTTIFRPLIPGDLAASRSVAKARLLPAEARYADSFIVLNANRNQPRKCIDVTMRGFAEFAEGKPENVHLYLHMAPQDLGWDVVELAKRFGIERRLILSTRDDRLPALSDDQLNLVYNACDVGVSTAAAEGWGLVAFEHGATGAPQVLPRAGPLPELWGEAACWVDPALARTLPGQIADWHVVDATWLAVALDGLYQDRARAAVLGERALAHVRQSRFSWPVIGAQWCGLVASALEPVGMPPVAALA